MFVKWLYKKSTIFPSALIYAESKFIQERMLAYASEIDAKVGRTNRISCFGTEKLLFCPYEERRRVLCLRGAGRSVVLHPVGLLRYGSPSAFSIQRRTIPSILNLSFSESISKCHVETGEKETHILAETV